MDHTHPNRGLLTATAIWLPLLPVCILALMAPLSVQQDYDLQQGSFGNFLWKYADPNAGFYLMPETSFELEASDNVTMIKLSLLPWLGESIGEDGLPVSVTVNEKVSFKKSMAAGEIVELPVASEADVAIRAELPLEMITNAKSRSQLPTGVLLMRFYNNGEALPVESWRYRR